MEELVEKVSIAKEASYKELTMTGIEPFSGVVDLVKDLIKFGIPFGLGSSGSPEKIRHNLSSSGLLKLFPDELIVSAKMVSLLFHSIVTHQRMHQSYSSYLRRSVEENLHLMFISKYYVVLAAQTLPKQW